MPVDPKDLKMYDAILNGGSPAAPAPQPPPPTPTPSGGPGVGSLYQAFAQQNPGIAHLSPEVQQAAFEAHQNPSGLGQGIPQMRGPASVPVDPYTNLANKATGRQAQ